MKGWHEALSLEGNTVQHVGSRGGRAMRLLYASCDFGAHKFGIHIPTSTERELSEFLSAYEFLCKSQLTEFFAELTEFVHKLSEFSLPKQCSRNCIPPVS